MKLFIGGLPSSIGEAELKDFFSEHGDVVSVNLVVDHVGASRGFAFVTMATAEQALRAIEKLNGKQFEGRTLTVQAARGEKRRQAAKAAELSQEKAVARVSEPEA